MAKTTGDGIPIPDVIDPPDSMQMTLCIPRNRDHMAAFFGALYQLTVWQSWQEDPEHNGTKVAKVWWRYFLSWNRTMNETECEDGMSKCCVPNPAIKRFDPETERPQISYDDGATWQPDPVDPMREIQVLPPIVRSGSPSTKCDAATNAIQHINELITATGENLTTAADVFTLAVAVAEAALGLFLIFASGGTLTAPVLAVATAIWAATAGVFALGIDGYNAYWTTDKQDLIFCKIVCNIGENGQFTEAQYQAFRSQVKAALPASAALDVVMTAVNAGGAQGMSQMASYGNWATADCDSCVCFDDCASKWTVWDSAENGSHGTITGHPEGAINAVAGDGGNGNYYLIIHTSAIDRCCKFESIVITEGSFAGGLTGWCLCNETGSEGVPCHTGLFSADLCVNYLQLQAPQPFSVTLNVVEC